MLNKEMETNMGQIDSGITQLKTGLEQLDSGMLQLQDAAALLNQQKTQGEESVYDLIDFNKYDGVVFFEKSFSANKSMGKRMERYISEKCNKPVVVLGNSTVLGDAFSGDYSRNIELLTDHIIEQHNCELLYFLGGYQGYATKIDIGFINSLTKGDVCPTTSEAYPVNILWPYL